MAIFVADEDGTTAVNAFAYELRYTCDELLA
jgi:hypothetical protein